MHYMKIKVVHSVRMKLGEEQSVVHKRVAALHVVHGVAAVLASHVTRRVLPSLDAAADHLVLRGGDFVSIQAYEVDLQFGVVTHD